MSAPRRVRLYERQYVGSGVWRLVHPDIPEKEMPGDAVYVRADIADEMLEALKRVHTIMDRTDWDLTYAGANETIREEVEHAIAKAEGGSE